MDQPPLVYKTAYELAEAFARSTDLADFSAEVSITIGQPVEFGRDGKIVNPKELTGVDNNLIAMLNAFASQLLSAGITERSPEWSISDLLSDLVTGKIQTRSELSRRLSAARLIEPATMVLVSIQPEDKLAAIPADFVSRLSEMHGTNWSWRQNDDLQLLLPSAGLELRTAISEYRLLACVSDEFHDLLKLPEILRANTRILTLAGKIYDHDSVIDYDHVKLADLILTASMVEPAFDPMQYVSQTVSGILTYDQKNHTEFLYTLYCFITSASSYVAAARKLHVHKNTVSYRIRRMTELFNIDLESIESKFEIFFSCYLLRIFGLV